MDDETLFEMEPTTEEVRSTLSAIHYENLMKALRYKPEEWEYTGEMGEQNPSGLGAVPCACGHTPIRYLFPWKHKRTGEVIITGSHCVEQIPGMSPEGLAAIQAQVQGLQADRRMRDAAARDASKGTEAAGIIMEIQELAESIAGDVTAYEEAHGGSTYLPNSLYYASSHARAAKYEINRCLHLKSASGKLNCLKRLHAELIRYSQWRQHPEG